MCRTGLWYSSRRRCRLVLHLHYTPLPDGTGWMPSQTLLCLAFVQTGAHGMSPSHLSAHDPARHFPCNPLGTQANHLGQPRKPLGWMRAARAVRASITNCVLALARVLPLGWRARSVISVFASSLTSLPCRRRGGERLPSAHSTLSSVGTLLFHATSTCPSLLGRRG